MPRLSATRPFILKSICNENNGVFKIVNQNLYCSICSSTLESATERLKERSKAHVLGKKHLENLNSTTRQPSVVSFIPQRNVLNDIECLIEAFINCDIPLYKLDNPHLRSILEKKFGKLPSTSTLRKKMVPEMYEKVICSIKEDINNSPVFIMIDETRDKMQRNVFNLLIGKLDGEKFNYHLVGTAFLDKCDAKTVAKYIVDTLRKLEISDDKIWLALSDAAPYMVSCFSGLKLIYHNLRHVTCIAHALNLVCEKVRWKNSIVDNFIGKMKIILNRSYLRVDKWKEITGLPLPPEPCITRWGTWIEAASFYAINYNATKAFVHSLDNKSKKIADVKDLIEQHDLKVQLEQVYQMKFMVSSIKKLEESGLTKEQQLEILDGVKERLDGCYLSKLQSSLNKNPDIEQLRSSFDIEFNIRTKYAPLTSVEVERSFSVFKNFLRQNRLSMTEENIEKYLAIQHFNRK